MGARLPSSASTAIANVTIVTTAETVIAITPSLSQSLDSQLVMLFFMASILYGAGSTQTTFRIRRGTTTAGVQVTASILEVVGAGQSWTTTIPYSDVISGSGGNLQWCLTAAVAGAGANHTVNDVAALAMAL